MFEIIVAHDKNKGIGKNNTLPWHISEDLKHFKAITTNNTVIMGRNTWHSLPKHVRPLPNRTNIVLSSSPQKIAHNLAFTSLNEALKNAPCQTQTFIIGGETLYKEAITHPQCKGLWVTSIQKTYHCDTYFPNIPNHFEKTKSTPKSESTILFNFEYWANKNID